MILSSLCLRKIELAAEEDHSGWRFLHKVEGAENAIQNLDPGMGMIQANYQFSGSDDVALHRLERLKVGTSQWDVMDAMNRETMDEMLALVAGELVFSFLDSTVVDLEEYRYRMIAIDSSENQSSSAVLTGTALDDGIRGTIFNLDGEVFQLTPEILQTANSPGDGVLIQWDYDAPTGLKDFVIYRKRQNEPLREYATVVIHGGQVVNDYHNIPLTTLASLIVSQYYFVDTNITRTGQYEYRVLARHFDGGFSKLSDKVTLTIH